MESQIKVTFWLNRTKKDASKRVPIYLRVLYNYEFFTKSTGLKIKESVWDQKAMRVRGSSNEVNIINSKLESTMIKVHQIITQLTVLNKPFNIHTIKDTLDGKSLGQVTVLKAFDEHLKFMKRLKGKEYEQPTIIKYANTRLRIQQFTKWRFKRKDLYLYELNDQFLTEFEMFLKDKFDNSKTTCYKHYQRFTLVVRKAISKGYLDKYPFREYKIRMPKKRIEYLDREELQRLEDVEITLPRLSTVRDVFIFCCYTGLAYAEVHSLRPEHIYIGLDDEKWLKIFRKKTKKEYSVPLLPKAMQIIEKYKNHPMCLKKGVMLPVNSNVKMNAYLKEIAELAKIYQNLTVHLARKTYGCTLLSEGVNIGVISKLLGHASIQVTLDSYASVMDELMLNNVRMIRKKFVTKNDNFEMYELKNNSAKTEILEDFDEREKEN
jgi:integrase